METAALVSSIVSIIIGGFAIWLSVTFYRMSNKISEDTKEAAKGISASVNRLESLFDSLYSDTFSMMKDTVTDMRKHIWPVKEKSAEEQKQIEEKADAKIDELKKQISNEVSVVMKHVGDTDSKIDGVEKKLEKLVSRAIQQTRQVESEAQEEKVMQELIDKIFIILRRNNFCIHSSFIFSKLIRYNKSTIVDALTLMKQRGRITFDMEAFMKNENTQIRLAQA